jgi:hypothetical protein
MTMDCHVRAACAAAFAFLVLSGLAVSAFTPAATTLGSSHATPSPSAAPGAGGGAGLAGLSAAQAVGAVAAFLGLLVHYYERLQAEYGGALKNVPAPTIDAETQTFRVSQDALHRWICESVVVSPGGLVEYPIGALGTYFGDWYNANVERKVHAVRDTIKEIESSALSKYLKPSLSGALMLRGCRVVTPEERALRPGEEYFRRAEVRAGRSDDEMGAAAAAAAAAAPLGTRTAEAWWEKRDAPLVWAPPAPPAAHAASPTPYTAHTATPYTAHTATPYTVAPHLTSPSDRLTPSPPSRRRDQGRARFTQNARPPRDGTADARALDADLQAFLADDDAADRMIDRFGIGPGELEGRVFERRMRGD